MDKKMEDLLNKINLDQKYHELFLDGKVEKVKVNSKNKSWDLILNLRQVLPYEVYNKLREEIINTFSLKDLYLKIISETPEYSLLEDYWIPILDYFDDKGIVFRLLKERQLRRVDKKITVEVHSKIEKNSFDKNIKEIIEMLDTFGFSDVDVDSEINKEVMDNIKEEITKDLTKELEDIDKPSEPKEIIFGEKIKGKETKLKEITHEENNVIAKGYVFDVEEFESSKNNFKILTLKITDYEDSLYVKIFTRDKDEFKKLKNNLAAEMWIKVRGYTKNDPYSKDIVLNARDINLAEGPEEILDEAPHKRIELHTHTFMSQMDGVVSAKDLIKKAKKYGHSAIAITDHNALQAFPEAFYNAKGIKIIYGVEISVVDDSITIVKRANNKSLLNEEYVVFDFETTGFNPISGDSIIEVGAVKLKNGEIIDEFSKLINPGEKLEQKIIDITGITNEDLEGKENEETVIKEFIEWTKDSIMVAHNAPFDSAFLEACYKKYNLGDYKNTLIDTLVLSRNIDSGAARHGLAALVKRYDIKLENHHRATDDAKATALVFDKMIHKMVDRNIETIEEINNLITKEDIHKNSIAYHINILVKNQKGLKNLFKLVSLANTKYFYRTPKILKSLIEENREGLLIGSGCASGEIFNEARTKSHEELINLMSFYDYIEVQPPEVNNHLVQSGDFRNEEELKTNIKKIIEAGYEAGKPVVATGDVHHLDRKDKVIREIIINQNVPGGGRHPLNRQGIDKIPSCHFRTTEEMIEDFSFIDFDIRKEIVIDNPKKVADQVEEVQIIKDKLYTPKMEGSAKQTKDMVYKKAHEMYGENLPEIVEKRIKQELDSIIEHGFDVIYLIAEKLVKKSNDDGYLVGSRGSVGSSFVATLMDITEVNPLPAHYLCPKCGMSIFEENGESLGSKYLSGYDLPDRTCECGEKMQKEGQDMPFAVFLGFKGDKVPDIDLNFSGDYQAKAHDYTKVLFGEDKVYRAGTIGTVASKTAYGFTMGYKEDKGLNIRPAEIDRLTLGCTGIKRTTGQHPGGIIVIPNDMDIYDFSPYQYPADDVTSRWYTTHFDFHAIHDNVLKLDILGHDDPTMLKVLSDYTGVDIKSIPFDDKKVLSLFSSPKALGLEEKDIMCSKGTLGIPEFGTDFVIGMLEDTNPTTFEELVKISGLSHGTDVWLGNAQELVRNKICDFKEVIGCRDDIMVYLMYAGLEPIDAFKIMEVVRKKGQYLEEDMIELMKSHKVPEWYIKSCDKIKYMFPKAHATAYVMMGFRVAYFKVYYPIYYYSAFFSIRCSDFDVEAMIGGYDKIKTRIEEIIAKGYDATNKENAILATLKLALESTARGITFSNIDLERSESNTFVVDKENNSLIPPFNSIDGLGTAVAENIVKERKRSPFVSIEDAKERCKISTTLVDKMREMGIFKDLPESSQLSLF